MSSYCRVVMMGNLTRDPEVRKTASGTAVATLGLAMSESYRNAAGETVDKPCYVDVVTWGDQAENCAKYLKKGRAVLVDGKLQFEEWEGKGGEKRNKLRVRAQSIQFLGGDGPGGGSKGAARQPAPRAGNGRGVRQEEENAPF